MQKLGTLRGYVPFEIVTGTREVVVPRILQAEGKTYHSEDWTIHIEKASWDGSLCRVKLTAKYLSPKGAPEWQRVMQDDNIKVLDKNGLAMEVGSMSSSSSRKSFRGTFAFRPPHGKEGEKFTEPTRLVYRYMTESKVIKVPFEFKDLALP